MERGKNCSQFGVYRFGVIRPKGKVCGGRFKRGRFDCAAQPIWFEGGGLVNTGSETYICGLGLRCSKISRPDIISFWLADILI